MALVDNNQLKILSRKSGGKYGTRRVAGVPNRLEQEFAAMMLTRGMSCSYETITFRLAVRTTYTPDFFDHKNLTFYEVKGFWGRNHASRVKLKIAAKQNPWAKFFGVTRVDGEWVFESITAI